MYPGYGEYWEAVLANPNAVPPFQTRVPLEREVAYAKHAVKTPHYIVSKTLAGVSWPPTARIVRDLAALRPLKEQAGGNIYVVGGPTLVTNMLNENLLDELKLIVHPLLLGGGKPLFAGVHQPRFLKFVHVEPGTSGKVSLTYRVSAQ
jgi:dihydrofolate reductase